MDRQVNTKVKFPIGVILYALFVVLNLAGAIRTAILLGFESAFPYLDVVAIIASVLWIVLLFAKNRSFLLFLPIGTYLIRSVIDLLKLFAVERPGGSAISTAVLSLLGYCALLILVARLLSKKESQGLGKISLLVAICSFALIFLVSLRLALLHAYYSEFSFDGCLVACARISIAALKNAGLALIALWIYSPYEAQKPVSEEKAA